MNAHVGTSVRPQRVVIGTYVQPLHARAGTSILTHCRRAGTPARRFVFVREPLLIRIAFLDDKREIFVTCVPNNITSSAERAIDLSVHRLRRGFTIHDCKAGPISWRNQGMGKHFADVELASTSH